jgi:hypothetical protein
MVSFQLRALGWVALLTILFNSGTASAANIYGALLGGSPTVLTAINAQNPAEVGHYEYIYDVYMDNESQFQHFQIEGFDATQIINQHAFTHASITGILTQKWDAYAQSPSISTGDQTAYGSYNDGGSWTIPSGYTGLGEGILNQWHSIGDYSGTTSGGSVNPQFLGPGALAADSLGAADHALLFVNDIPTSTLYNGLVATFRVVHPAPPATITFTAYSGNGGGTPYTNTLVGPGAVAPEPSTLALLGLAVLSAMSLIRYRPRR